MTLTIQIQRTENDIRPRTRISAWREGNEESQPNIDGYYEPHSGDVSALCGATDGEASEIAAHVDRAAAAELRRAQIIALRCVLALWDEADLAALLAFRRAREHDADASLRTLQNATDARATIRYAYAGSIVTSYPRTIAEHLRNEAEITRAGAKTTEPIAVATRTELIRRARWIEAVIADAIERIEGRRGDDVALPVEAT